MRTKHASQRRLALAPAAVAVPERFQDLTAEDNARPCDRCGVRASFHFDGWSGNRLDCEEAQRRHGNRKPEVSR